MEAFMMTDMMPLRSVAALGTAQELADEAAQALGLSVPAVIFIFVTLVIALWRAYSGAKKGFLSELFSFIAVVLAFACILLGMNILRRFIVLLPVNIPVLSTLVGASGSSFPQNITELASYIPTLTDFLKTLPGLLLRLFLLYVSCKLIAFLGRMFKVADEIPVVSTINRILGALLGIVEALLIMTLVLYILGFPVEIFIERLTASL